MSQMAQQLGLSRATVSMVINGREDAGARISAETRRRVLELAEQMNYRANRLASSVASGKTTMLGFLVLSNSYEPYWRTITGAIQEAEACGYTIKVLATREDSLQAQLHRCAELRLAGIIARYDGAQQRELIMGECQRFGLPLCFVDDVAPHSYGARVFPDEKHGCQLAVSHLQGLGHRHIAYLGRTKPDDTVNFRGLLGQREAFFIEALQEAGLPFDAGRLERDPSPYHQTEREIDVSGGLAAVQRLLDHPAGPPTAIVAHLDQAAMTAVRAIRARGLRVPQDVSVVGYSDFELSRYFDPPLSNVVSPWNQMGRAAVQQLMLQQSQEFDATPLTQSIAPGFIARQSSAPAPQ